MDVFGGSLDNPRPVTPDELVTILTILVHQLGGEASFDAFEVGRVQTELRTVKIEVTRDPWMMILKEVSAE